MVASRPLSLARRWRLRAGWAMAGMAGDLTYFAVAASRVLSGGWLGALPVYFVLLQAGAAALQALWARRYGLSLVVSEYAILFGIGMGAAFGLTYAAFYVEPPLLRIMAISGIFVSLIAAPVRALRGAGVRRGAWWMWNLVGASVGMAVIGLGWAIQMRDLHHSYTVGIYLGVKLALAWFSGRPVADAARRAAAE